MRESLLVSLAFLTVLCDTTLGGGERADHENALRRSPAVFTGTAAEIRPATEDVPERVVFRVARIYKGIEKRIAVVRNLSRESAQPADFEAGNAYLVYTRPGPYGGLATDAALPNTPLEDADRALETLGEGIPLERAREKLRNTSSVGGFYSPNGPMPLRLRYSGGIEGWNAKIEESTLLNQAFLEMRDAQGDLVKPNEMTASPVDRRLQLTQPFSTTLDLRRVFGLTPGAYFLEWGSGEDTLHEVALIAVGESHTRERALRQLEKKVRFAPAESNDLQSVLQFVENMTAVPLSIDWPRLRQVGAHKDTAIELDSHEHIAGRALQLVLWRAAGEDAVMAAREGTLAITSADGAGTLSELMPLEWRRAERPWRPRDENGEKDASSRQRALRHLKQAPSFDQAVGEARLADLFNLIENEFDVKIFADWRSLEGIGVGPGLHVVLKEEDMTGARMLSRIRKRVGSDRLAWGVDPTGVVILTTESNREQLIGEGDGTRPTANRGSRRSSDQK